MSASAAVYFITGVTGFVGKEILRQALTQYPQAQFYCLIRARGQQTAEQRLHAVLQAIGSAERERVHAVSGDTTLPQLGLSLADHQALCAKTDYIIHSAAMVDFAKPEAVLGRMNVGATENIIAFAKACQQANPGFQNLAYISTAYVAGRRSGIVTENDFSDAYGFKNNYEASKYEAEKRIHQVKHELPLMIFRPSIIIGSSEDGAATENNVIYPLIEVSKRYKLGLVPLRKKAKLDVVPVDYVAQSLLTLMHDQQQVGQVFHLTCRRDNEVSLSQAAALINQVYQVSLKMLPHWLYKTGKYFLAADRRNRYILRIFENYYEYMVRNPEFCQQQTQQVLNSHQISCPDMHRVFEKTLVYAKQHFYADAQ